MNFDDNAMFRRPEILELRDLSEEDPMEVEAGKNDLAYIKLTDPLAVWLTEPVLQWQQWI